MNKVQEIAARLGVESREADGAMAFHSAGMLGVSLSDLQRIEREIRQAIANEIAPRAMPAGMPVTQPFEVLESDLARLKSRVASLARKVGAGSADYVAELAAATLELTTLEDKLERYNGPLPAMPASR